MPPKFRACNFIFAEGEAIPEHEERGSALYPDPTKYALMGQDGFSYETYPLAVDIDDEDTAQLMLRARRRYLRLDQSDIPDDAYLVEPSRLTPDANRELLQTHLTIYANYADAKRQAELFDAADEALFKLNDSIARNQRFATLITNESRVYRSIALQSGEVGYELVDPAQAGLVGTVFMGPYLGCQADDIVINGWGPENSGYCVSVGPDLAIVDIAGAPR